MAAATPSPNAAAIPPAVGGSRVAWWSVPERVRAGLEEQLGSVVVEATSQPGGFSPGSADRVVCADGRRAFVKAVGLDVNPDSPAIHRRELAIARALPPSPLTPRLLGGYDDGDWVALAFEDVEGHTPEMPWRHDDVHRVVVALESLATVLTPSPVTDAPVLAHELAADFTRWELLALQPPADLDPWALARLPLLVELGRHSLEVLAGDTLVHADLRADNLILTSDRVVVVDWPWASLGAPWIDTVTLALNAAVFGGHNPDAVLATSGLLTDVAAESVTAVVAGLAGYFSWQGRQRARPEMPTIRAFQLAQGQACLRWLRGRVDRETW